jgi:hypothetical protein
MLEGLSPPKAGAGAGQMGGKFEELRVLSALRAFAPILPISA